MKKNIKFLSILLMSIICFCIFTNVVNAESINSVYYKIQPSIAASFWSAFSTKYMECSDFPHTLTILKDIFKYIRIGAVVLFIVLTSADYITAIMSDEKEFKASNRRVVTRLALMIGIIILPSIINLILNIIQLNNGTCGIN